LDTPDALKEHLAGLLPAGPSEPVALSDGAVSQRLGLREWLAASGRPVVPTLKEFIAGAPDGGEVAAAVERYKGLLLEAAVGITTADYALADTGTLVLVSGGEQHRLISLLPPTHVCLLDPARILPSLSQLLARLRGKFGTPESAPKNMTCITGPSRTADIEQAITMGVHGPKSLHVILYAPAAGASATTRRPPPDPRESNGAS
jgi:L-lactate dehydrogenase complex protein LldG